ncbi:MAG: flagellar filament capping protein FliD, partial [Thermodesulfobacteriota bacterium]
AGVSDLFNAEGGVAASMYDYLDEVTDTISGSIASRTKGLTSIVTKLSDEIERAEARLEEREEDLIAQFAKLESILSSYSTQASYLSSILSPSE